MKCFFCSCSLKCHPSFRPTLPPPPSSDYRFFDPVVTVFFFFSFIYFHFDMLYEFQKGRLDIFIFTTRLNHSSYANLIGTRKSSTPTGQVDTSTVYFSAPYFVISSSCFCFVFETKYINQSQQNCDFLGRCFLKHSQHFRGM